MTENNQQRPKLIASFSGVSAAPPRLIHHKSPITHRRLTPFLFSTNKPHRIITPMRAPLKTKDKQFSIQYKLTVGSIGLPAAPRSSRKEVGMLFLRRQLLQSLSFAFGSSFILGRNHLGMAAQTAVQPKTPPPPAGAAVRDAIAGGTEMEKVTGIGGFFFRAKDPKALTLWYQQHLGISTTPTSDGETPWQQDAGATAFTPFPETTKYFGDASKVWMLNFRVRDLDKMAAQLQAAGIEVKVDPESYPYGRFARLHDPEGNPIELWQPKVAETKG
jgi:predicted enzyme related to lactoylglutathione lyase